MPLKVRVVTDRIIPGDEKSLTPAMIKAAVSSLHTSVTAEDTILTLNGVRLECDHALLSKYLKPSPENAAGRMKSLEVFHPASEALTLKLQAEQGQVAQLAVRWTWTVQEVKEEIELQYGTFAESQILSLDQRELDNEEILSDLITSSDTSLQLGFRLTGAISVSVRQINGRSHTIRARSTDTIEDLKYRLKEVVHMDVDDQRILFARQQLHVGETLGSYGIQAGSNLHFVAAFRPCDCGRCGKYKCYLKDMLLAVRDDGEGDQSD